MFSDPSFYSAIPPSPSTTSPGIIPETAAGSVLTAQNPARPKSTAVVIETQTFASQPTVPVVTLRCKATAPKVSSFYFDPQSAASSAFNFGESSKPAKPSAHSKSDTSAPPKTNTRFRPPRDMIKLEDRLFYMLQPPLESLMANGTIEFPFTPFPYQFAGIAFLFARQSAIMADEMGLGKNHAVHRHHTIATA